MKKSLLFVSVITSLLMGIILVGYVQSKDVISSLGDAVEALTDSEGTYSCSVMSYCYSPFSSEPSGSVSCTGLKCTRGYGWVECDGNTTLC